MGSHGRRNGQKWPIPGLILNLTRKALEKGPTSSKYRAVPQMCSTEVYEDSRCPGSDGQPALTDDGRNGLGQQRFSVSK